MSRYQIYLTLLKIDGIPDYPQESITAHCSSTAIKVNYSFIINAGWDGYHQPDTEVSIFNCDLSGSYDTMVGQPLLD